MKLIFERTENHDLSLPGYETVGSSGLDIKANLKEGVKILPGSWKLIPTGFKVQIPSDYELQVRPRSGLANKYGLTILNGPGTIDSDYRGEIGIILVNQGDEPYIISHGDRIAQLVLARVHKLPIIESQLEDSARGSGGFGSTGR